MLHTNNMPISFSWDLHYKCNYRCPYCWWRGQWLNLTESNLYLSAKEWARHWERIYARYGSVRIDILGGEPLIYPDFVEIIKKISSWHTIRLTTNLSINIDRFVHEMDPSRVKVTPTFHPAFAHPDTFMQKCIVLKERGLSDTIGYLAYPPQIRLIPHYKAKFNDAGLELSVMTFWGQYNNKDYPAGYTEEEKDLISLALGKKENNASFQLKPEAVTKGKLCSAGSRYAVILGDGTAIRCGGSGLMEKIGCFFDDDFHLLQAPQPCNVEYCKCNEWVGLIEKGASRDSVKSPEKRRVGIPIPVPQFPRVSPPYKVHWNWEPTYECNYQCSYCTVRVEHAKEKPEYRTVDEWKAIWDGIFDLYGSSHIRISGGEPFVYPKFIEIIRAILEKHTVDITTNLSFDQQYFLDKVPPKGISISASFHPDHTDLESLLKKILILNQKGYPSAIAYVAYPPHLKDLLRYKRLCEERHVLFKIIPFHGEYDGKKYPAGYTEAQKQLLQDGIEDTQNTYQKELNKQWYSQNMQKEKEFGRICRMGQMYAKIHPDGKVTRCCVHQSKHLGNIFDGSLRLLDRPAACDAQCECPCFKAMLVNDREDKWLSFWPTPSHHVYKTEYYESIAAISKNTDNPSSNVPGQVFFTWDIHYACNYKCSYCFFVHKWDEVAKENIYPGIDKWINVWKGIYDRYGCCHLHISGGEPFTYPDFIDLVSGLVPYHTIEFDTNLSFDIHKFMDRVAPGRIRFASAFHPQHSDLSKFIEKALILRKQGYDLEGVNFVAYPLQLQEMQEYKKRFEENGIKFVIMPFRGKFDNREYPEGYTSGELQVLADCGYQQVSREMMNWYKQGEEQDNRKSKLCHMGRRYAKIHPNGIAYRCCIIKDSGMLGNLLEGTFRLYDEPRLCMYDKCSCFKAMIAGEETNWEKFWQVTKTQSGSLV